MQINNKKVIAMSKFLLNILSVVACFFVVQLLSGCTPEDSDNQNVIRVLKAQTVLTLEGKNTNAVAMLNKRIIGVDDYNALLESLPNTYPNHRILIDAQFANDVITPGFINQHDHPWLAALTLSSHVISIEDWELPHATYLKAQTPQQYLQILKTMVAEHTEDDGLFLSWGYHKLWHGELTRDMLDAIGPDIPMAIWQRSVHEFILNTKALQLMEIDETFVNSLPPEQKQQTNYAHGHFWESSLMALSGKLFKHIVKPKSYLSALNMVKNYWQSAGTTLVVEPGGLLNKNLSIMQNHIFSQPENPFHMDYIVDGKTMAQNHMADLLASTEEVANTWGEGMSRYLPKQVKLFSDGAVFSQLMQMSQGYSDGHHGEWIMQPDVFKQAFEQYWDAGYQIHVHQNGDAGLDMVLDTLADNMQRNPRQDHRTVIVHFSYSRQDQVTRLKELGAIVSVNPYYPVALAEMYSEVGVGAERSHAMVRLGDLVKQDVSFSLHSDMPMAPGQPLFLMWCAVNRMSNQGNIIGPEHTITAEQALRAVTLNAAYSMQLEQDIGSIKVGKLANFTVLKQNPLTVDPITIKDIEVLATVHEGRILKTQQGQYEQVSIFKLMAVYWDLIWLKITSA